MRINVAEWRKMNRAQKYILILIAYGYWLGRHQKRRKLTSNCGELQEKVVLKNIVHQG